MRFPEDKIKAAILHPDLAIRDRAISYFANSFSTDTSLMPLVIQAVETYGRNNTTYQVIGAARELPQTEDTIAWIVGELNAELTGRCANYPLNLSMILTEADPRLLLSQEAAILSARHFLPYLHESVADRLRMTTWDFDTCWQQLEAFGEETKDDPEAGSRKRNYGSSIVEALARFGQASEERVRTLLAQNVEDYTHHPMLWLEPLLIRLAGRARLESSVPLLLSKLMLNDDVLDAECTDALTWIGTPAVVQGLAELFPTAEEHLRMLASSVLENIHSDVAVEACLRLLDQETDDFIRRELTHAILLQFASEGVERARQYLLGRRLDVEDTDLRTTLLETCTLTGDRFPEYEEWLATEKAEKEEHQRRLAALGDNHMGTLLYSLERLAGKQVPVAPKPRPPLPPAPRLSPPPKPEARKKVGRNDPCPCGSGKKFKHCCLKK